MYGTYHQKYGKGGKRESKKKFHKRRVFVKINACQKESNNHRGEIPNSVIF
jgi:hypothetical protein